MSQKIYPKMAEELALIVLIGPHGSGKTTLGRLLARALGWSFAGEIGKQMRYEALARDPEAHALLRQPAFDLEVTQRELGRDEMRKKPQVVETWHPGNLAYAEARSLPLLPALQQQIEVGCAGFVRRVWVQPLTISMETLRGRLSEPGPEGDAFLDGLMKIGHRAVDFARGMGCHVAPSLATDTKAPEELCEAMLAMLPKAV